MQHKKDSSAKAGMLPGSAVYVGSNPPVETKIVTHIFDDTTYQKIEGFEPQLIHSALANNQYIWVDVTGLADVKQITQICAEFAMHPLIIEDIMSTKQRSKLDDFGDSLFITFKLFEKSTNPLNSSIEQFSMVMKEKLLLSFRESANYNFSSIYKNLASSHSILKEHGDGYLSYMIMDYIVDDFFNFVEESELILEDMENLLIKDPPSISLPNLYAIKRHTTTLRKIIAPLRDIINLLITEQVHLIDKKYLLYYHDLFDHSSRLLESLDLQREMITGILEIYLSTLNTRMNETMKVLTIFASLFIPLTFIAGVYGMNFVNMPELKWRYSYPAVLTLMLILALLMFYYFKRKKLL